MSFTGNFKTKRNGFDEADIEEAFTKFDVDGDRILDVAEQKQILEELQKLQVIWFWHMLCTPGNYMPLRSSGKYKLLS